MSILWWIFWLYVVPAILTAMFSIDGSLFDKHNMLNVFMPVKNLWEALIIVLIGIAVTLISFGDFCEDVWKSFKKHFC